MAAKNIRHMYVRKKCANLHYGRRLMNISVLSALIFILCACSNRDHNTNAEPRISGTPAIGVSVGSPYSFAPDADDSDGDTLTFGILNKPSWAVFDTATGALTGLPSGSDAGVYSGIVIYASDGNGGTASLETFTITVSSVNSAPSISGTPATDVTAGDTYSFAPVAEDSDNDTLVFSITNKPAWADFSATTGELTGTPANADTGNYTGIIITVSDGNSGVQSLPAFNVTVNYLNSVPAISGTPLAAITGGGDYSFTPTTEDADGDTLTFSIENKPSWASFDTATGALTGTPTNSDEGAFSGIVITVSDGKGGTAVLASFSITVNRSNTAPTIGGTPSASVTAGSAYGFVPTSNDADGDTLTFSIENKPSWASFDTATGALSGTPANSDEGTFSDIAITVSDGNGGTAVLASFSITVNRSNTAPAIGGTPPTNVKINSTYGFVPTSSDADGDTLTFSIENKPSWASFDTATGALSGTPVSSDAGTYANIIITADDGSGGTTSLAAFTIEVAPLAIVFRTGQTISYADYDDGFYLPGRAFSFSRDDANDIVMDNVSGLMWEDDTAVNSRDTWQAGVDRCAASTLGGYDDWRMPEMFELITLTDYGNATSVLNSVFVNRVETTSLSANENPDHPGFVYYMSFDYGTTTYMDATGLMSTRCVRGAKPSRGAFTRDDVNDIVTNVETGLQWQDNAVVDTNQHIWRNAVNYCNNLSLGGYTDWRLPSIKELESTIDYDPAHSPIDSAFQNGLTRGLWTSTTNPVAIGFGYVFSQNTRTMLTGYIKDFNYGFMRCVRGGEYTSS